MIKIMIINKNKQLLNRIKLRLTIYSKLRINQYNKIKKTPLYHINSMNI